MLNLVHSVGNVRLDCLHLHVIIGVYLFAVRYKLQNMLLVCFIYFCKDLHAGCTLIVCI